jgi:pyridoxal phosphate enzyme (YggS family)
MDGAQTNQPDFRSRLARVRERIDAAARRSGREAAAVRLIAVSKTVSVEAIQEATNAGCRSFGENRVQEALSKMEALAQFIDLEWHLIGPVQTNKVKAIPARFALIHSIDRVEIARRLHDLLTKRGMIQSVLLEVNIAGEESKHGFQPESLTDAVGQIAGFRSLQVVGLMTIPPVATDPEEARPHFRHMKKLASHLEEQHIPGVVMRELSMGMSNDFECAIEEGATMVRLGTALFGERLKETP